jgi:hypothetical protein
MPASISTCDEPIEGLGHLPVLRVPDECAYYKEDAGKMMLGAFEPRAKPWGMDGHPRGFRVRRSCPRISTISSRSSTWPRAACRCSKRRAFTPSSTGPKASRPMTATISAKRRRWTATGSRPGYNSIGIVSSGGAGMALAQWIVDGEPPFDLWEVDIRRAQPFQRNRRYLKERVTETLGLLYADHWPYRQVATARGVRRSPGA